MNYRWVAIVWLAYLNIVQAAEELSLIPEPMRAELAAPEVDARSWMLLDYETGWILASNNIDDRMEPASLTKLMTSYLVFDALNNGTITLDDMAYVSEKAWRTGGSKMFIEVGKQVAIGDLLQGLIVQSGNDAAVALAEHIGGSESGFAEQMNTAAKRLGMVNSNFVNSSGLPNDEHYSTTADMMLLANAIIRDFPQYYPYYSQREYRYNDITQQNRNLLLSRDADADGLKTGYTEKAGYVLIGTTDRDGHRLIAMVTGTKSKKARADEVQKLLNYGYSNYQYQQFYTPGEKVTDMPLYYGEHDRATVTVAAPLALVFPKGQSDRLSASLDIPEHLEAPLRADDVVGTIAVKYDAETIVSQPLVITSDQPETGFMGRLVDYIRLLF